MKNGIIVAPQPEAVEAGAEVLMRGGNAVDAAIACALVQGVVDPQMCGIAGFGSFQVYLPARGEHRFIDFHGKTPAAATPEMWQDLIEAETRDGFGFRLRGNVNDLGYQSITVPGSLLAYHEALTRFGTLSWPEALAPAIARAEAGFVVRPHVYHFWTDPADARMGRVSVVERLRFSETGRRVYFDAEGAVKQPGDRVLNPDLARCLRRLAEEGVESFYRGAIAAEIDRDMRANGALLTGEDLAAYRTTPREPLRGTYRGFEIATNHPPGGGIMLLQMLNILEQFDLASLGHNSPEYIRVVAEAMKRATADKDAHVGDPDFVEVPVDRLLDKGYAAEVAEGIRQGRKIEIERYGQTPDTPHTTHISVVDRDGNAVSMTHSLGMPSGVISPGLGFMFNGCMAVFDPRPGRAGSIAPGKARFSSICPTIVFRDGAPVMVVGAPGGTQIAMGVLQSILNHLDFGMSVADAVNASRFSATSNFIDVSNRIPDYLLRPLEERGYRFLRSHLSYTFGAVHALGLQGGSWHGAADPGHDGMALSV